MAYKYGSYFPNPYKIIIKSYVILGFTLVIPYIKWILVIPKNGILTSVDVRPLQPRRRTPMTSCTDSLRMESMTSDETSETKQKKRVESKSTRRLDEDDVFVGWWSSFFCIQHFVVGWFWIDYVVWDAGLFFGPINLCLYMMSRTYIKKMFDVSVVTSNVRERYLTLCKNTWKKHVLKMNAFSEVHHLEDSEIFIQCLGDPISFEFMG